MNSNIQSPSRLSGLAGPITPDVITVIHTVSKSSAFAPSITDLLLTLVEVGLDPRVMTQDDKLLGLVAYLSGKPNQSGEWPSLVEGISNEFVRPGFLTDLTRDFSRRVATEGDATTPPVCSDATYRLCRDNAPLWDALALPPVRVLRRATVRTAGRVVLLSGGYYVDPSSKTYYGVYYNSDFCGSAEIVVRLRWADAVILLKQGFMEHATPQLTPCPERTNRIADLDAAVRKFFTSTEWATDVTIEK